MRRDFTPSRSRWRRWYFSPPLRRIIESLTRRRRTRHGGGDLTENHADVSRNIRQKHAGNYCDEPADHRVVDQILTVLVAPNPEGGEQAPHLLHSGVLSDFAPYKGICHAKAVGRVK